MSDPRNKGKNGGEFVDDTNEVTGQWFTMKCIGPVVITSITMPKVDNSDAIVGPTLADGTYIDGEITAVKLASGLVQLIKY